MVKVPRLIPTTEVMYVPYDLDIEIIERFGELNIELFKKMILATATIS